jgi:antitoxin component YwqK of YwqJK toxin-antitoxin module
MRPPLLLLLALLSALATACAGSRPAEHLDHHDQRQGRWRTYYDDARTQLFTQGRYRHGQPVGRWRYYDHTSHLQRRERYRHHGFSDITYYYPNGRVARQGRARVVEEPSGLHFYWLGEWQYYSPAGTLDSVQTYALGQRLGTRYLTENRMQPGK